LPWPGAADAGPVGFPPPRRTANHTRPDPAAPRHLKEGANQPAYWSAVSGGGASAGLALDTTGPCTAANPVALRRDIAAGGPRRGGPVPERGSGGGPRTPPVPPIGFRSSPRPAPASPRR